MTRKRLYLLHVTAAVGFCGTLLYVAPPLAPAAVGFCAVYLAAVGLMYLLGWFVGADRLNIGWRFLLAFWGCVVLWIGMTGLDPWAGVAALFLAPISLWPRRSL